MTALYGFVVGAFLLVGHDTQLPMASMEACAQARAAYNEQARGVFRRITICIPTGARR